MHFIFSSYLCKFSKEYLKLEVECIEYIKNMIVVVFGCSHVNCIANRGSKVEGIYGLVLI